MRELKFRAPIIENGECHFLYFEMEMLVRERLYFSQREILLPWLRSGGKPDEYTGLKDKNEKEIYEGDIVQNYALKDVVIFDMGVFTLRRSGLDKFGAKQPLAVHAELKVIGNIYQDPELLEATV